jgi:2-haloacid dehalogenase
VTRTGEISAVVWDFGGVLTDWDPVHLYRSVIVDAAAREHFLTAVCSREWHLQHDAGARFADTIPALKAAHPEHAEWIDVYLERYVEMIGGAIPGTGEIVAELADGGVRQYGLTNMPDEAWPAIREAWPVLADLDGVVVSGTERVAKPDPAIFRLAAERFGLDPTRTVFIDDVARNVEAAVACGFRGVVFTDAVALRADLAELGLPLAAA